MGLCGDLTLTQVSVRNNNHINKLGKLENTWPPIYMLLTKNGFLRVLC